MIKLISFITFLFKKCFVKITARDNNNNATYVMNTTRAMNNKTIKVTINVKEKSQNQVNLKNIIMKTNLQTY